ncbi:hypothetical protein ANCCAN_20906 [Ancylostoma caninum]|uniref:PDZ domain-containing protein n=1 Tax=Ancylostoma caninum TaxID=29170 RepID=A0A368FM53_ANCCA|nr:hypothetical protein ANCCAN_20906 [Ancylostoma caninum]
MKNRQRNLDVVHHGLVLISDGKGRGRPSRLLLSKDQLSIEIPSDSAANDVDTEAPEDQTRTIVIKRKGGGLGLSIKGGTENAQNLPIVISKIFPGMPGWNIHRALPKMPREVASKARPTLYPLPESDNSAGDDKLRNCKIMNIIER